MSVFLSGWLSHSVCDNPCISLVSPERLKQENTNFICIQRVGALTKNMQIRSNNVGVWSRDLLLDFRTHLYLRNGEARDFKCKYRGLGAPRQPPAEHPLSPSNPSIIG